SAVHTITTIFARVAFLATLAGRTVPANNAAQVYRAAVALGENERSIAVDYRVGEAHPVLRRRDGPHSLRNKPLSGFLDQRAAILRRNRTTVLSRRKRRDGARNFLPNKGRNVRRRFARA